MTTPMTQTTKTLFAIILPAVLAWVCEFHPLGDNYQKRLIPDSDKIAHHLNNSPSYFILPLPEKRATNFSLTHAGCAFASSLSVLKSIAIH
ncbi:MAG: hypothetical protein ACKODM_09610 [Cytophagales bacterium]